MFLAAAHFSLGDLDAAKAALDDGLERNPNAIELMPVAASIYSQIGLHDEARAFVKKWLPDAEWEQLEATVEKYFFVVRWYKDYQRLNMTLHDGLRRASLPDEMSVDALIDGLETNGIHASFKTARYLGWYGEEAVPAVPALISVLSSDDQLLTKEAIIALGKIGPGAAAAVPALEDLVSQPFIGARASTALAQIQSE